MIDNYTRDELLAIAKLGIGAYERIRGLDAAIEAELLEVRVFSEHGGTWGPDAEYLADMMRQREELKALALPPAIPT